jgi:hypothetical protein
MIATTIRPYSEAEKQQLIAQLPSRYKRFENFVMTLIFALGALLLPFLLFDKYFHFNSSKQIIFCVAALIVSLIISRRITKHQKREDAIKSILAGQVEVTHVKTSRALERKDPEDFGAAFYLEVVNNGKAKVLYLQGQYLDEIEEALFPATDFEVIRRLDNKEVIELKIIGNSFKPEKVLPVFDMEDWRNGNTPNDGDIFDMRFEDIT